jgi:hypothetical protein
MSRRSARTISASVFVAGCALLLATWVAPKLGTGLLGDSKTLRHADEEDPGRAPAARHQARGPQHVASGAKADGARSPARPESALPPTARVPDRELTPAARDFVRNRLAALEPSKGRTSKVEWRAAGLPEDHPAFQSGPGDQLPSNVGVAIPLEQPPLRTKGGLPPVVFEEYRRELAGRGVAEPSDRDVLAFIADQNARVRALNEALWEQRHELRELRQSGRRDAISSLERELIHRHFLGSEPPPDDDSRERMSPEELAELRGRFLATLRNERAETEQRQDRGGTP